MAKKLPYFPFYYLDWLSSSSVLMMTHEEKGLFIDMLARCYNDDGLPDDNFKLKRLFNCNENLLNPVKEMFYSVEGLLKNKKLDDIIKSQQGISAVKSKAGKASAKSRASKKLRQSTHVEHVLNSVATEAQHNSTNRTEQNRTNNTLKSKPKEKIKLPDFLDEKLWNEFLEIRKKLKAQNTERAIKTLIKKLEDMEAVETGCANKQIEESIINSWKGVFEPKNQWKGSSQRTLSNSPVSDIKKGDKF